MEIAALNANAWPMILKRLDARRLEINCQSRRSQWHHALDACVFEQLEHFRVYRLRLPWPSFPLYGFKYYVNIYQVDTINTNLQ